MTATTPTAERTCRIVFETSYGDTTIVGVSTATAGAIDGGYVLYAELEADCTAVRVVKDGAEMRDAYVCRLSCDGRDVCCTCPDYRFRGRRCKHMRVCESLCGRGKLPKVNDVF